MVTYDGSSYVALTDSIGQSPTDNEYWQLVAEGSKIYQSVAEMKADTNLKEGMAVSTLGYYEAGDGGEATYSVTSTESEENFQEELDNGLLANLIFGKVLSPKQLGAYGDNLHDDSQSFKKLFELMSKKLFYDISIVSDYNFTYTVNIPNGEYLLEQENIFENIGNMAMFNTVVVGNCSKLIFNNFTGDAFNNNNLIAGMTFKDVMFISKNDGMERILFNIYSTGKAQNLKFINCSFTGNWKYVFELTGTNNNSEFLFNECYMNGTWNSFLHSGSNNTSDQFVNYWFNNCRYWCSSCWIDMVKGGHIKLNDCDISGYQPSEETYLYKLGSSSNYSEAKGVTFFTDSGSRYELKTTNAKVINAYWNSGNISFNNCDFSSQANNNQILKCFLFNVKGGASLITFFNNCRIYGEIYKSNTGLNDSVITISNSYIYKDNNSLTNYNDNNYVNTGAINVISSYYKNKLSSFSISSGYSIPVLSNTYITKPAYLTRNKVIAYINSPTFVDNIKVKPLFQTNGYTRSLTYKTKYGVVLNVSNNVITVSDLGNLLVIGDTIIIGDYEFTITALNKTNNTITVQNADNNPINVNDDIYLKLGTTSNFTSNRYNPIITTDINREIYNDIIVYVNSTSSEANPIVNVNLYISTV